MKTKFGMGQFFSQNTPALMQKIGDLALMLSVIGVFILGIPATMEASGIQGFVLPAFLMMGAKYCIAVGALIKAFSKMWGQVGEPAPPIDPNQTK